MKWFKHETDAHTNLKLQAVIEKFGMEAYGYYWVCDEIVGRDGENFQIKGEKSWKIYLKKQTNISISKQERFLAFFADLNLIDKKALHEGILSIPKLQERSDDYTNRVRRKSEQDSDNVPLEEKRVEEKRREESVTTPSQIARVFFQEESGKHTELVAALVRKGASEPVVRRELAKFISYWTEPNKSGTKQRWETERTFEVGRRLATWFSRVNEFNKFSFKELGFAF